MNKDKKMVIYMGEKGKVAFNVAEDGETIWATYEQMAEVFGVDRTSIVRHVGNIYRTNELDQKRTCAKSAQVRLEGSRKITRQVDTFNLDMIISVGYRVNSQKATNFRIWATKILRKYTVNGAAINRDRLAQLDSAKLRNIEGMLNVVHRLIKSQDLSAGEAGGVLEIITEYSDSFKLLEKYDDGTITFSGFGKKAKKQLTTEMAEDMIDNLKTQVAGSDLFGKTRAKQNGLDACIGALYQTYSGRELYPTIAEKAANLLYLIIKDHPFYDGNKRIAALLFIVFLTMNDYHLTKNGNTKISDRALVALALLIAESAPTEKDLLIALICKLLEN